MHIFTPGIILTVVGLLITVGSGFWLCLRGRPLNTILFNIHKLTGLTTIVIIVLSFRLLLMPIEKDLLWTILIYASLSAMLTLLSSGGMLSFDKFGIPAVVNIHRLSSLFILITGGTGLYILSTIKYVN